MFEETPEENDEVSLTEEEYALIKLIAEDESIDLESPVLEGKLITAATKIQHKTKESWEHLYSRIKTTVIDERKYFKQSLVPVIPLFAHPAIEEAKDVYILNDKDVVVVKTFFKNKYGATYSVQELEDFFSYMDTSITKYDVEKKIAIKAIEEKAPDQERLAPKYINMQQQMLIDGIFQIYYKLSKDKEISNVNDYIKLKKTMADDIKAFRDNYQLQLQVMGMGKDPEQIKSDIEARFASMINKMSGALDDYPEAQEKLNKAITAMFSTPGTKNKPVEEDIEEQ